MLEFLDRLRSPVKKEQSATAALFEGEHRMRPSRLARRFQERFSRTIAPLVRTMRAEGVQDGEIYPLIIFLSNNILIVEINALTARPAAMLPEGAKTPRALRDLDPLERALRMLLLPLIRLGHPYPDLVTLVVLSTANAVEESHGLIAMVPN